MKRGEIWTLVGGASDVSKLRPAVIAQNSWFDANDSVLVYPLTTHSTCPTTTGTG